MVHRRQASGAVEFVTDVVTRTFSLLVKVTLVMLLLWAVPTFAPSVAEYFQAADESKHIEFAYSTSAPTPQVTTTPLPSAFTLEGISATASVLPRPSE